jgi:hypothetical protein
MEDANGDLETALKYIRDIVCIGVLKKEDFNQN